MANLDEKLFELSELVKPNTPWDASDEVLLKELSKFMEAIEDLEDFQEDFHDVTENLNHDIDAFREWLKKEGLPDATLETLEIADFGNKGFGLRLKKSIKKGDLVLQVPHKLIMTEQSAFTANPAFAKDPLLKVMPSLLLSMHLLSEASKPESFWRPYIAMLPDEFRTPFYYTLDEIENLRGSPTVFEIHKCLKNAMRQYCFLYKSMEQEGVLGHWLSWKNFVWAQSVVMTRQNQIPVVKNNMDSTTIDESSRMTLALIPLWDLSNHTPASGAEITTFFNGNSMTTDCHAVFDFKEGDEHVIFYGPRPNSEFLLHSGFAVDDNPNDVCKVTLGLDHGDPLAPVKGAILKTINIAEKCQFLLNRQEIDPNALAFLRICQLSKDELKGHGAIFEGKSMSVRNDVASYAALAKACNDALGRYVSTVEDDKEMVAELTDDWGFALKCFINVRMGEMRVLEFNRDTALARMRELDPSATVESALVKEKAQATVVADPNEGLTPQQIKNRKKKAKKAAKKKGAATSSGPSVPAKVRPFVGTWSTNIRDKGDVFKVMVAEDGSFEAVRVERKKNVRVSDSYTYVGKWALDDSSLVLTSDRCRYVNGQDKFFNRENEQTEIIKCLPLPSDEKGAALSVLWCLGHGTHTLRRLD